jgi:hypothetical protein
MFSEVPAATVEVRDTCDGEGCVCTTCRGDCQMTDWLTTQDCFRTDKSQCVTPLAAILPPRPDTQRSSNQYKFTAASLEPGFLFCKTTELHTAESLLRSWQSLRWYLAFYGNKRFITAYTRVQHSPLSWACSVQPPTSHPILSCILILSSHLYPLHLLSYKKTCIKWAEWPGFDIQEEMWLVFFITSGISLGPPSLVFSGHQCGADWQRPNAANFCSGSNRFGSRLGYNLSWLRVFVVFLSLSKRMSGQYLKVYQNYPLPNSYYTAHQSWLCLVGKNKYLQLKRHC